MNYLSNESNAEYRVFLPTEILCFSMSRLGVLLCCPAGLGWFSPGERAPESGIRGEKQERIHVEKRSPSRARGGCAPPAWKARVCYIECKPLPDCQ